MTQKEIAFNRKCAKFLGWKKTWYANTPRYYSPENSENMSKAITVRDMKFHSDWNWIMEAVDTIEKLNSNDKFLGRVDINSHYCEVNSMCNNQPEILIGCFDKSLEKVKTSSKKEAVVQAIDEFLTWYEQNK